MNSAVFEANLKALRKHHPALARQMEKPGEMPGQLVAEMGKKGHATLKAQDALGAYYLHSVYDPVREAEQQVEREVPRERLTTVVALGFGLGFILDAVRPILGPRQTLVAVEPSAEVFRLALYTRDLSHLFRCPEIRWVVGLSPRDSAQQVSMSLGLERLENWYTLLTSPFVRMYPGFGAEFAQKLSSIMNTRQVGIATNIVGSELMVLNSLLNIDELRCSPGVHHLRGRWSGRPAIIVSSGPSLEQHFDLLRECQDHVLLVAAGSAWRILRRQGIEAHLVLSVDPFPANFALFSDQSNVRSVLGFNSSCNVDVVRKFEGKKLSFHASPHVAGIWDPVIGPRGVLDSGGSVANSAFSLLLAIGASPIVFVGQDLAYTNDRSHADGYIFNHSLDEAKRKVNGNMAMVPGYYGGRVPASKQLDTFRNWFEQVIARHRDLHVINATEGGARIEGAIQEPLKDVLARYVRAEPLPLELLEPDAAAFEPAPWSNVRSCIETMREDLGTLAEHSARAASLCEKLSAPKLSAGGRQKLARKLGAAERQIKQHQSSAKGFIDQVLQGQAFKAVRHSNLADGDQDLLLEISQELYENIHKACQRSIGYMEKACELVENRHTMHLGEALEDLGAVAAPGNEAC